MDLILTLIIGFALGYFVRDMISRRRRATAGLRQPFIERGD